MRKIYKIIGMLIMFFILSAVSSMRSSHVYYKTVVSEREVLMCEEDGIKNLKEKDFPNYMRARLADMRHEIDLAEDKEKKTSDYEELLAKANRYDVLVSEYEYSYRYMPNSILSVIFHYPKIEKINGETLKGELT